MSSIPNTAWPDKTIALLREGNEFIGRQCDQLDSPIFQTRLLLKKTVCMRGAEAAELFYDNNRFSRQSAAPRRLMRTLIGNGGVQGLDDQQHVHRKAIFLRLMTEDNMAVLEVLFKKYWTHTVVKWENKLQVTLFDEVNRICFLAACEWVGIQPQSVDVDKRTRQMLKMIASPASIGLTYVEGVLARKQAEKWMTKLISDVRAGKVVVGDDTALKLFATYKDLNDKVMDLHAAAVDLLNVIRPIVAIGRFITFAATALSVYPSSKALLEKGSKEEYFSFVQEVRRFYPFFPFAAAKVKHDFNWNDLSFEKDTRVLLDLYGTNNDPRLWENPRSFQADRFLSHRVDNFNFVPQGGGSYSQGHRCPGEEITKRLMVVATQFLVTNMSYQVPEQDLEIDFTKMPTLPNSGLILSNVRLESRSESGIKKAGRFDQRLYLVQS